MSLRSWICTGQTEILCGEVPPLLHNRKRIHVRHASPEKTVDCDAAACGQPGLWRALSGAAVRLRTTRSPSRPLTPHDSWVIKSAKVMARLWRLQPVRSGCDRGRPRAKHLQQVAMTGKQGSRPRISACRMMRFYPIPTQHRRTGSKDVDRLRGHCARCGHLCWWRAP